MQHADRHALSCLTPRSPTGSARRTTPARTAPARTPPARTIPARIAALLHTVRILLGYGRHLAETAPHRSASTDFNAVAACFGTGRLYAIIAHLQRGLLRATALERVLLARAARGRDIGCVAPSERATAAPPAAPADPLTPRQPTVRRSSGRTTGRGARRAEAGAAVAPGRLEQSRTVHADIGGTRGASAPPPARPHLGRYLP